VKREKSSDYKPKSSSLFHFTSKVEYLQSILTNGFQPRYSMEYWPWFNHGYFVSHAMTCFCDIPLTRISDHVEAYGRYGLGMSRDWIREYEMQPLTYCPEESVSFRSLKTIISRLKSTAKNENKEAIWNLCRLYKLDYGPMFSRTGKLRYKDFTQESEWRYVPNEESRYMGKNKHKHPKHLSKTIIKKLLEERDSHASISNPLQEVNSLNFSVNDLRYIFVSTDNQLVKMIEFIENLEFICNKKLNKKDRSLLMAKLTSLETIGRDY